MVRSLLAAADVIRDRNRCRLAAMARSIAQSRCRPTIHEFHAGELAGEPGFTEASAGLRSRVEITLTVPAH
jgi:hypothetical protein